ncbi:MAG: heme exporter protein CcmB [Bernardetiaceae bacterium]|nr:heme exporter protein CcmB [Bernardetiaceae bacterium]
MGFVQQVFFLIQKELRLEWRQRTAINGIILYLVATVFVCYLSFQLKKNTLSPITWNALFWIIMLFAGVNAVAKSFSQESEGRQMYYYSIFSPEALIVAKMIYNAILMLFISGLGFSMYVLVMGNPVADLALFTAALLLGALGFSTTLTMISSISAQTQNANSMMAVLSFPIILPMLLMLIKLSKNAIDGLARSVSQDEFFTLLALNGIVASVAFLLFPFLWRA